MWTLHKRILSSHGMTHDHYLYLSTNVLVIKFEEYSLTLGQLATYAPYLVNFRPCPKLT